VVRFVLSLWKFLHISAIQSEHGLSAEVVENTAPMALSQLLTLQRGQPQREEVPVIYNKIKVFTIVAKCKPVHKCMNIMYT